jgi:hypothetical protein
MGLEILKARNVWQHHTSGTSMGYNDVTTSNPTEVDASNVEKSKSTCLGSQLDVHNSGNKFDGTQALIPDVARFDILVGVDMLWTTFA